ncbi:MAG: hypothetical protein WA952_18020 [Lewinella sp.]
MDPVKIKFGTDGWREIIAQEYTVDNVKRVADGTARWLKEQGGENNRKWEIVNMANDDPFKNGPYPVTDIRYVDGTNFYLDGEDRWLMVRPGGTEPVLRVYAQGADAAETRKLLDAGRAEMGI